MTLRTAVSLRPTARKAFTVDRYKIRPGTKCGIGGKTNGIPRRREQFQELRWHFVVRDQKSILLIEADQVAVEQPVCGS